MGTLYIDTGGSATNSGSTDQNAANLTGTAATVAGSVVSLDGSPALSGLVISGPTQSAIHINDATNANRKIFWITAFDDVGKTITVDVAPTGVASSVWAIGGRHVLTNASIEGALRGGDTAIFNNSPAPQATALWTFRNSATGPTGFAKIKGKTGVRPVLTCTSTANVVNCSQTNSWLDNLELVQQGGSGAAVSLSSSGCIVYNVKISQAGGDGISHIGGHCRLINCEIAGVGGSGINCTTTAILLVFGCYIHDLTGSGIVNSSTVPAIIVASCIIDTCAGRGMLFSGATTNQSHHILVIGCTVYGCGDSGIEVTDQDTAAVLLNTLFQNNGNAAGESNVEWVAGTAESISFHGWNLFYNNSGADPPINFTVNAQVAGSELTTDPFFQDPVNGNFSLLAGSPAINAGSPIGLVT